MKITKIEIKDFHQFKDFSIDLTYPKGHAKEGQPLDKVCFIGQSGTGKTTLLEIIPLLTYGYATTIVTKIGSRPLLGKILISVNYGKNSEYFRTNYLIENEGKIVIGNKFLQLPKNITNHIIEKNSFDNWLQYKNNSRPIYFPANLNYEIDFENEIDFEKRKIIDFSRDNVSKIWNLILQKVQTYQEQELKIRQDISKVVEKSSNDVKSIQEALRKLEVWKSTQFNPIQDLADNCLNRLLANYKLKVKTEFDFTSKEDIGFIKIEDYAGNEIPHGLWSTGTKQVVLSAMPLYLLKPKHTLILFDEPERSLYPDLQRTIVDYYTSLSENCQFFYSTHSPIIASSFEPWEIVELKFNNEGKVYRELYYEGENHIDNYKWNPKYMRWDDILQRVFDLEDDGSPERKNKLNELATLNVKYKKLKKQGKENEPETLEIIEAISKLSKELSKWD